MARVDLVTWVARNILPHEPALRRWLRRSVARQDIEDVIQEAYCSIAAMDDVTHIVEPRRYFFQVARNIVLADLRRARVVQIEAIGGAAEMEQAIIGHSDELSPERIAIDRDWLARVGALLAALPERRRIVFRLRKLEGLSQREAAERLGVTEMVVENDLTRGLRSILAGLSDEERSDLSLFTKRQDHVRPRLRRRH
jgi:RNA polymerase sigma factor (sigma-70 family)